MPYTPAEISTNLIAIQSTLDRLRDFLGIKDVQIVKGGPSIVDPCGMIDTYIAFKANNDTGFWFGVGEGGRIVEAGAHINGQEVRFPKVIQL